MLIDSGARTDRVLQVALTQRASEGTSIVTGSLHGAAIQEAQVRIHVARPIKERLPRTLLKVSLYEKQGDRYIAYLFLNVSVRDRLYPFRVKADSPSPTDKGLDTFVRKLRDGPGIKLYIDWHSYGQYILSPYGYNETLYAPELGKWTKAASVLSQTIRDSSPAKTTFTFGPSGATCKYSRESLQIDLIC